METYTKRKSLATSYNGLSIGHLLSIRSVSLAGAQTCHLFKNDLVATCKRSNETNSDLIAKI